MTDIFDGMDLTPRYAPDTAMVVSGRKFGEAPVKAFIVHPPGLYPKDCPIKAGYTVLELRTDFGSRWYGCKEAYINSELRMVVIGTHPRDEVRMKWPVCQVR